MEKSIISLIIIAIAVIATATIYITDDDINIINKINKSTQTNNTISDNNIIDDKTDIDNTPDQYESCPITKEWACKRITTGELADPLVPNEIVCGCSPKTCPDDLPYLIVTVAGEPWPNGYRKGSFVCEKWPPA